MGLIDFREVVAFNDDCKVRIAGHSISGNNNACNNWRGV